MKKFILFLILLLPVAVYAEDDIGAKSAVLLDTKTEKIIYEKNKDERLPIASLTKMALQTIVLENIENKTIKWDDMVEVSENAANMGGSQIYLSKGEKMSVYDLFRGVSMASANDAAVALGEYIAGSEEEMTKRMNKLAKRLGLNNTNFKNVTGLDEEGAYSSAEDVAKISLNLLKHKKILEFSSMYEGYLRENTNNKFWLVNTNRLLRLYKGTDGLKTGHTDNALYTTSVTAKRNNERLLVVLLGEDSIERRNKDAINLLNYGFTNYKSKTIKTKNDVIKEIKIKNMNKSKAKIYLEKDANILIKKQDRNVKAKIKLYKLNNLRKNKVVGKYYVYVNNKLSYKYNLIIKEDYYKESLIDIIIKNVKRIILGKV